MPMHTVIADFLDLKAGRLRREGEEIEVSEQRARELQAKGLISTEPVQPAPAKQGAKQGKKPESDKQGEG